MPHEETLTEEAFPIPGAPATFTVADWQELLNDVADTYNAYFAGDIEGGVDMVTAANVRALAAYLPALAQSRADSERLDFLIECAEKNCGGEDSRDVVEIETWYDEDDDTYGATWTVMGRPFPCGYEMGESEKGLREAIDDARNSVRSSSPVRSGEHA